jgi:hypothetical protein
MTSSGLRIRHREFIVNIEGTATGEFTPTVYFCNPGLSSTFPWLAQQANLFQQYTVHSMVFEFITRSSTNTNGGILMAPEYDVTNPAPQDEKSMTAYQNAVSGPLWSDVKCKIDTKAFHGLGSRLYTRAGTVTGDIKTFDGAKLYVWASNINETALGQLWVNYDISLKVPQITAPPITTPKSRAVYYRTGVQEVKSNDVLTTIAYNTTRFDNINSTLLAGGLIELSAGIYQVRASVCTAGEYDPIPSTIVTIVWYQNGAPNANIGNSAVTGLSNAGGTGGGITSDSDIFGYVEAQDGDTISVSVMFQGYVTREVVLADLDITLLSAINN